LKDLPPFEKWIERNTTTENGTYRPIGHWKMEKDLKQGELWKRTIRERPAERPKVEEAKEAGKTQTHWWKVFG
jgi:hypothetical protein